MHYGMVDWLYVLIGFLWVIVILKGIAKAGKQISK